MEGFCVAIITGVFSTFLVLAFQSYWEITNNFHIKIKKFKHLIEQVKKALIFKTKFCINNAARTGNNERIASPSKFKKNFWISAHEHAEDLIESLVEFRNRKMLPYNYKSLFEREIILIIDKKEYKTNLLGSLDHTKKNLFKLANRWNKSSYKHAREYYNYLKTKDESLMADMINYQNQCQKIEL